MTLSLALSLSAANEQDLLTLYYTTTTSNIAITVFVLITGGRRERGGEKIISLSSAKN